MPPSEGYDATGLALRVEAGPARQDRRDDRRFGKGMSGIDGDHDDSPGGCRVAG